MGKRLFVSYWALGSEDSGLQSFMGNQEVQWDIQNMSDIELLEKYIKKTLVDRDVPVAAVTILNWKTF